MKFNDIKIQKGITGVQAIHAHFSHAKGHGYSVLSYPSVKRIAEGQDLSPSISAAEAQRAIDAFEALRDTMSGIDLKGHLEP